MHTILILILLSAYLGSLVIGFRGIARSRGGAAIGGIGGMILFGIMLGGALGG